MKNRSAQFGLVLSALVISGCSGLSNQAALDSNQAAAAMRPNQVMAWVPADQARTPTVARAMVHIALGNAKQATEQQLCQGEWIFTGDVEETEAPNRGLAPANLGGFSAWQYRIAWSPELPDCPQASAEEYYRTLSSHLPSWMLVQFGTEATLYRQGVAVVNTETPRLALQRTGQKGA